jgi:phospholipid-transporting ATPase
MDNSSTNTKLPTTDYPYVTMSTTTPEIIPTNIKDVGTEIAERLATENNNVGETRVDLEPNMDVIVSFQIDVGSQENASDVHVQKHVEEDMAQVVEDHDDLQVVKKSDVDFVQQLEQKSKNEVRETKGPSVTGQLTQLSEYGSALSTSVTNSISDGYQLLRKNTVDRLPAELRSVKQLKKSTNAIVRKTLQIQMDDDSDEEEEEVEPIDEEPRPTSTAIPPNVDLQLDETNAPKKDSKRERKSVKVYANDRNKNRQCRRRWPSNYIKTTKYRWWSFIPQNLFEQFRRIYNIYFLITIVLQCIPAVSPVVPTSSILPFCIIIILTALKDLYEDILRFRADRAANGKLCYVLRDGELQRIASKDLEVGDIVRVDRDDTLCADVVCLSTHREDGACYIDTAQLDGETSLKTRRSVKATHHMGNDPLQYKALRAKFTIEAPSANLDKFNGRLSSKMKGVEGKQISSLDMNNLLLRGCTLRNTKYAYGVVIYVGEDTKLFKNLKITVAKFSHLDKRLNYLTILMIVVQQIVCWFFTGVSIWYYTSYVLVNPYIKPIFTSSNGQVQNIPTTIVLNYMTYFSLSGMLLPMGLFLSLEFIKTAQSKYIERDKGMKYGDVSMQVKTSQLNQGLSQLDIIFSDKTGTLTCNEMHFAKAWINGTYYDEMKYPKSIMTYMIKHVQNFSLMRTENRNEHPHWYLCQEFLMCLLLNHSIIPELDEKTNEIVYDGLSSDEIALLSAARNNGFKLLQRTNAGLLVDIHGNQMFVEILAQLDFTSDRKRMTVAVKIPQISDNILVYCKGADTVMVKLLKEKRLSGSLRKSFKKSKSMVYSDVQNALDQLGNEGLRTLIMCKKEVPHDEFMAWLELYNEANSLVGGRDAAVAKVALELERDFEVLGCTAIEDRLQEEVPQSVQYLLDAGLQVWMLTGDKTETAINIAYAANVLRKDKTIEIRLRDPKSLRHFEKKLQVALEFVARANNMQDDLDFALIIDSKAIKYSLMPVHEKDFLKIISVCKSAICCRCTPKQKAAIVKLIESSQKKRSLAIGDGVNDVAMIQAATIGVGIMGREGSQAARASDYAIPRFRHLVRLIAVHGRYSYIRNSDYLHLSFYKNNALVFLQLIFNFFDAFSGGVIFDSWTITMYNTVFAQIPPIYTGIFERDLKPKTILKHPELYSQLKNDALFNMKTFTLWNIIPLVHCIITYFGIYFATWSGNGILGVKVNDLNVDGTVMTTVILVVYLLRHALETKYFTWLTHVVFWFCFITYIIWCVLYNLIPQLPTIFVPDTYSYYWIFFMSLSSLKSLLIQPLLIVACLLPDITFKFIKRHLNPDSWEYILLQEKGYRPSLQEITTQEIAEKENV